MIKNRYKIVLLILFKIFNDFYDILNINYNVYVINYIFSNILICF